MLDVPPHLFQPLSVDTNISYDLDMSKFPGLDDPQQMYQPALLIATDWSNYVYCDVGTESSSASSSHAEDDLFALIESCDLPGMDTTNVIDGDTFQSIIDDVVGDTVTPFDVLDILDTPDNSPCSDLDTVDHTSDIVDTSYNTTDEDLSPLTACVRGKKRRRSSDIENHFTKQSKAVNYALRLPALVSVCPTSNHCARHRDS